MIEPDKNFQNSLIKTYGHERGFSCCFRQYKAESHCRFLHGYALAFELTFTADKLDRFGWVVGFGELRPLEDYLRKTFDHKFIIDNDDPWLEYFMAMGTPNDMQTADIVVMTDVSCEGFAYHVFNECNRILGTDMHNDVAERNLKITRVKVSEHGSNSAIYHRAN